MAGAVVGQGQEKGGPGSEAMEEAHTADPILFDATSVASVEHVAEKEEAGAQDAAEEEAEAKAGRSCRVRRQNRARQDLEARAEKKTQQKIAAAENSAKKIAKRASKRRQIPAAEDATGTIAGAVVAEAYEKIVEEQRASDLGGSVSQ